MKTIKIDIHASEVSEPETNVYYALDMQGEIFIMTEEEWEDEAIPVPTVKLLVTEDTGIFAGTWEEHVRRVKPSIEDELMDMGVIKQDGTRGFGEPYYVLNAKDD